MPATSRKAIPPCNHGKARKRLFASEPEFAARGGQLIEMSLV
jgi:hypothetical protein